MSKIKKNKKCTSPSLHNLTQRCRQSPPCLPNNLFIIREACISYSYRASFCKIRVLLFYCCADAVLLHRTAVLPTLDQSSPVTSLAGEPKELHPVSRSTARDFDCTAYCCTRTYAHAPGSWGADNAFFSDPCGVLKREAMIWWPFGLEDWGPVLGTTPL